MRRIPSRSWTLGLIGAIGVLAVAVRFYRLTNRSLWLDEIFTAKAAHLGGPGQVIAFAQADIDQMPLFYMFTWLLHAWGDGAFILRLQSVLAGTLAVVAVLLLGRSLLGVRAAVVAALLMTLMPYAVWYSQEARNYALFMLLSTLQMYFAYSAIKRGRWFDWSGLAITSILNLYNHYLALETTAAVAVYIGAFLLFDLLRKPSNMVRMVTGVGLAALAVAAALVRWRPILKTVYAGVSNAIVGARNHRLIAVAVAVVVLAVFAVVAFALRHKAPAIRSRLTRPPMRRLAFAAVTGLAVGIAYAPWVPSLRVFLSSPSKGFGRLDLNRGADFGALASIPVRLGLSGFILALFCLGLVALGVWTFRGRSAEAALLIFWLTVPLILLWLSVRWAIVDVDLRYFAFLFPAAMLVTAAGGEAICIGVVRLFERLRSSTNIRFINAAAGAVVITLLLAQALPALAASYQAPKNDWRSTAEHIAQSSSHGSVVMAIGNYSDWVVLCLQYYFRQMHSSITVVDGVKITSDIADLLAGSAGPTWGVIDYPSAAQQTWFDQSSAVRTDFVDVTGTIHVVRSADPLLSAADQARQLLHWELPMEPQLSPSAGLLDLQSGGAVLGPNLVQAPPSGGWYLPAGASAGSGSILLTPTSSAPEANAYFTLAPPPAGNDFMIAFDHRSPSLNGSQTVSALAFDKGDHVLAIFPDSGGYACGRSDSWMRSYFAFTIPQGTTSLVVVLRADGSGTAEFRSVQLSRLSDNP